jgi:hypothetical protein
MYPLFALAGVLGIWWLVLWFRNPKETAATPAAATPSVHVENRPIFENKPVFENKPTFIVSTGAAPAETDRVYREVLAFLERTMVRGRAVMYFVEKIALETGFEERPVFEALERLVKEGHVFKSSVEGQGTNGRYTRWVFFYWYAHF